MIDMMEEEDVEQYQGRRIDYYYKEFNRINGGFARGVECCEGRVKGAKSLLFAERG